MIPAIFMMWALAAPMGFLVGDVFAYRNNLPKDVQKALPFICAVFTPLGAVLAILVVVQTEVTDHTNGDDDV